MFVSPEKPNNDIGDVNLIPNRIHACTGIWLIFMVKFGKYIFDGSEGIFIHTHTTWLFGEHALLLYNGQFCAIQNHVHFLTGLVSGESPNKVSHISSHGTFLVRQMENLEALATMNGQRVRELI